MHLKQNKLVVGFLWILIAVGVIARLYRFGDVPTSLNRDEAALGYTAWALSTDGIDEWGRRWPVVFESFGDFKLPGYIYTLVPLVYLWGPNPAIVRLPSLFAGIGLIFLMYFLAGRWSSKPWVRWAASALVALSPWAIFYSRMAFEANLGLFWLAMSLWLLLLPLSGLTVAAIVAYVVAGLTYNTPLLLAPVVALFVFIMAKRKKEGVVKAAAVLVAAGILAAILLPVLSQKSNITIFSDPTLAAAEREAYVAAESLPERLWNQRYVYLVRAAGERLLASVTPTFLVFVGGQNPWHSVPGTGHILLSMYGLAIISLVVLVTQRKKEKTPWALWGLALTALLPAIVTVDAPHATRSLLFLWLLPLPLTFGLSLYRRAFVGALVFVLIECGWYVYTYQTRMGGVLGPAWANGLPHALTQAATPSTPVVIRNASGSSPAAEQAYIFVLLYGRVPVRDFVATAAYGPRDSAGMIRVEHFTRYWFVGDNQPDLEPRTIIERNEQGVYVIKQ